MPCKVTRGWSGGETEFIDHDVIDTLCLKVQNLHHLHHAEQRELWTLWIRFFRLFMKLTTFQSEYFSLKHF